MKCRWLLESDKLGEDSVNLMKEVRRQGMRSGVASYIPLRSDGTYLDIFDQGDCVFCYGTVAFIKQVYDESAWIPGPYWTEENYHCSTYFDYFTDLILAQDHLWVEYGDLKKQREYLMEELGQADTLFIRPDSPNKAFTGQLIYGEEFDNTVDRLACPEVTSDTLVVVSPPRNILAEWRFVIADKKVIAGSQYREEGQRCIRRQWPEEVWKFAEQAADYDWEPDRVYCMDICQTSTGYWVLEINSVSTSGFYACDLAPIVEEVSRISVEDWERGQVNETGRL